MLDPSDRGLIRSTEIIRNFKLEHKQQSRSHSNNSTIMATFWSIIQLTQALFKVISGLSLAYDFYRHPFTFILRLFGVVPGQFTPIPNMIMGLTILLSMIIFTYTMLDRILRAAIYMAKKLFSFIWTLYLTPFFMAAQYAMVLAIVIRLLEILIYLSNIVIDYSR